MGAFHSSHALFAHPSPYIIRDLIPSLHSVLQKEIVIEVEEEQHGKHQHHHRSQRVGFRMENRQVNGEQFYEYYHHKHNKVDESLVLERWII